MNRCNISHDFKALKLFNVEMFKKVFKVTSYNHTKEHLTFINTAKQ